MHTKQITLDTSRAIRKITLVLEGLCNEGLVKDAVCKNQMQVPAYQETSSLLPTVSLIFPESLITLQDTFMFVALSLYLQASQEHF